MHIEKRAVQVRESTQYRESFVGLPRGIYPLLRVAWVMTVPLGFEVFNAGTGAIILVLILFANYYQFRIRRRFSGVIGKIMFWYSFGLAVMLALTIFNWITYSLQMDMSFITLSDRLFFIVAIACFLKGAMVIR